LSTCLKMYADDKRIRIVYRIWEGTLNVLIIAIGKRDDFEVYKDAEKRL
jgi:mRNA-degrading endonuclease RelE of RelBE toxin-antitoxin system